MNSPQEIFNDLFKDRGGRYPLEENEDIKIIVSLLDRMRAHIGSLKTDTSKLPSPYIDYIFNTSLNAVVTKHNASYYIGFHLGTIFLITDLFSRMLSNSNVLPDIGDPSKETNPKIFNAQLRDFIHLNLAKDPSEDTSPKDAERRHAAFGLAYTALNFLMKHEYGHIIFGHIDYYMRETNNLYYSEAVSDCTQNSLPSLDSQTLEMDADGYAVGQIMIELIELNNNPALVNDLNYPKYFTNLESSLYCTIFALHSLFKITGYVNPTLEDLPKFSHPPYWMRQRLMIGTAVTRLDMMNAMSMEDASMSMEDASKISSKAVKHAELAFAEISEQGYNIDGMKLAYSYEASDYQEKILYNWNNLRPHLEQYATGNLAPLRE